MAVAFTAGERQIFGCGIVLIIDEGFAGGFFDPPERLNGEGFVFAFWRGRCFAL